MKLRTRIFISFLITILVPTVLSFIILFRVINIQDTTLWRLVAPNFPPVKDSITNIVFVMVLILTITGLCLSLWLYGSISAPLMKLRKATKIIQSGELDFELDINSSVVEIQELCKDFDEMRRRLKESSEEKILNDKESKELISNISHDLKTPITSIKGYVEGIMDGVANTPEKMDRYIRTIYTKATDMDRLIDELTLYSKLDTNRIPYSFRQINIKDYLDSCADELSLELNAQAVKLIYENNVSPQTTVIADSEQLRRVINNIISNSLKYMEKDKRTITIKATDTGDYIETAISDNGKGIAQKDLPHIFTRFYRTDASRNSSKGGSGIGLAIVKKVLDDHGGKVWADSVEGEGTTITFSLKKHTATG